MMCAWAKERIAASWTGEIDAGEQARLREHLAVCPECEAEMRQLTGIWERLADMPAPEPSPALTARWEATLESLGGRVRPPVRRPEQWRFSLSALLPQRPVWQATAMAAVGAVCLLVGMAIGGRGRAPESGVSEIAALRQEVANTKEMVALSLLQQQSASERLRGVDYSMQMPRLEPEVAAALVQAVNQDPSVNVRLAAIDALTRASGEANVRRSLEQALSQQESPTVQAALISYLVDARDKQALGTLRQLATRPDIDETVRQRASRATQQLTEYK